MEDIRADRREEEDDSLKEEEIDTCPPQIGYRVSVWRSLLFYPLAVIPLCIGLLVVYWFPRLWLVCTSYKCELKRAHFVLVKDLNSNWKVERVHTLTLDANHSNLHEEDSEEEEEVSDITAPLLNQSSSKTVPYFTHTHVRYLYDETKRKFTVLRGLDVGGIQCIDLHNQAKDGLAFNEQENRLKEYGSNAIDVPVKSYHKLLFEEILHPFYIFQILSIIFWLIDQYFYYAGAVLLIFVISILVSLIQTRRQMQKLHDMVMTNERVTVIRDRQVLDDLCSNQLVPGDVLVVPREGMSMTCDAVLLNGTAIVNESMLTGESVPVTKTSLPLDHRPYNTKTHRMHTLYSGTHVVQTRYYSQQSVLALVIRTGFLTSKGGMVRSILFPKPLNMKFYWDSIKFILILSVLAACGFTYTFLILQLRSPKYEMKETILRAFDIITTIVPPSLPAAITVGTVYAVNRLRKSQIYCISPQRVNLCGKIKCVCFDKTGTLTEDSLQLLGVQPIINNKFDHFMTDISTPADGPSHSHLQYGMACCHSLTRINGQLTGDPLDIKMFLATNWLLEEPGDDLNRYDTISSSVVKPIMTTSPNHTPSHTPLQQFTDIELGILKQYTFSSELQRMSVLVRKLPSAHSRELTVYVKGSPEMIRRLSHPYSIPNDFDETLSSLTRQSYRVIAMGWRTLKIDMHHAMKLEREEVETDLIFCGFIVFENKLKPETPPTLRLLRNASIRNVMITGDNLLTGIAVSRHSGMVADNETIIVVKATNTTPPYVSYYIFNNESVDHSKLYSSQNHNNPLLPKYVSIQQEERRELVASQSEGNLMEWEGGEWFHLALDGHTFSIIRQHLPDLYQRILVSGTIFARMSPLHKKQLVADLMTIGYGVAMCGDGANDCGALKAAHVGISLSESEASVASPFTSKIPNITCVPITIREGRAALVTSFGVFKFMALYSLTEFTSVAILYAVESNLGDQEYLYIDLILILTFAFVIGLTGPYPHLVKRRPLGTLAGVQVFTSVLIQMALMVATQLGMFYYLKSEPWYIPLVPNPDGYNLVCSENTVVFTTSIFQYIALALIFSTSAPYRRPVYTNILFMLSLAVLVPTNLFLTLAPSSWLPKFWSFMQLEPLSYWLFRVTVVTTSCVYFLIGYLLESYILPSSVMLKVYRKVRCKRKAKNKYKHLLSSIQDDVSWPPPLPLANAAHSQLLL